MLRFLNILLKCLGWLFAPIGKNATFFVFMYALGWLCTQVEIPLHVAKAAPYENAALELFLDLYVVCAILLLFPQKIRFWVRVLLAFFFYVVALVDIYCYVRFESTLTPTMLMLVDETTTREAGEFFETYFSWDLLNSPVGAVLLLMLGHLVWILIRPFVLRQLHAFISHLRFPLPQIPALIRRIPSALLGITALLLVCHAWQESELNKQAIHTLMTKQTIGEVEHQLTLRPKAELYLPVYRLAFSLYANSLTSQQLERLVTVKNDIRVDSCTFRVPNIVLIIGESYNKQHSQLYGYTMPTTPRQLSMAREGSLVAFSDVVAPWNLTSYVFKNFLSLHAVGDSGDWCDQPLFPEVFRKAGYHVTFITNQFLPEAKEAVYDFSGGFFLNHPELSKAQFDTRNTRLFRFDEGVLNEYDRLKSENTDHNLIILHLMGSHTMYKERYPQQTRKHLLEPMYKRPDLNYKQRLIVADYDNSLLYNDSIVGAVTDKFLDQDAVVIYMPDHGEEIYNGPPYMYGRMHSARIDYRLAHEEFEIPFWIWGSPQFRQQHPDLWQSIVDAWDKPLMTDCLAQMFLYLGGIHTPSYREDLNVLSPRYNSSRPRILKGATDYNELIK